MNLINGIKLVVYNIIKDYQINKVGILSTVSKSIQNTVKEFIKEYEKSINKDI